MEVNTNYDHPWKEAIKEYSELFLLFFFPSIYSLIDWIRLSKYFN